MARPRKVWPSLCCIVCDIKLLYRQSLFPKQAAGRVYVDLFDLPQLLHSSSLFLWGDGELTMRSIMALRASAVRASRSRSSPDRYTAGKRRPWVIHHARQRDALSGGEDQRVGRMDTACIRESAPMMVPALPASSRK